MPNLNIPTNGAELEELLTDGTKMTEIVKNGQMGEVVKAYATNVAKRDTDIAGQLKPILTTLLERARVLVYTTQQLSVPKRELRMSLRESQISSRQFITMLLVLLHTMHRWIAYVESITHSALTMGLQVVS